MPGPSNTLLIDGSFEELSEEFAQYLDKLKRSQGDESSAVQAEVTALLEKEQKDEVLKKLVTASSALNAAPEKEFIAAYNLLIHLVRQSPSLDKLLPSICRNLSSPITSSPLNGPGLALSVLTTIFNIIPPDNDVRYPVFLNILRVVRSSGSFEVVKPQLKNVDSWITAWDLDEEDQRKLFLTASDVAQESGDGDFAYSYLLRALRTIPQGEVDTDEARSLSLKALRHALSNPAHFDFQDISSLDSVQALRRSDPNLFELLEIFSAGVLDDYVAFKEEHHQLFEEAKLDMSILERKMSLLTLASLAASTPSRSLPYSQIAQALQIQPQEVELWVIDVIRAGLVEGKLSQLNQTFLIHRSTYRVFGEKQWSEVQGRLDTWKGSLEGVLAVVRAEREKILREKERELRDMDSRTNGYGYSSRQPRQIDLGAD